jgi:hypothetical protein
VTPLVSGSGDRQVWWISFALFALLGGIWALTLPRLTGPDEAAHAAKAAAVVRGEFTWVARYEVVGTGRGDPTRVETWVIVPRAYAQLDYGCIAVKPIRSADCLPPLSDETVEVAALNSAGSYPPSAYLALGWPSLIFSPEGALHAMRAVHIVLCSAFLASALVAARRADLSRLTILGVAAALTPMVFFLASVVNPNGLEIATSVCVICAGLDVLGGRSPTQGRAVARLFVAASVMTLIRPASIALAIAAIALVLLVVATRARLAALIRDRRFQIGLGALGLAFVASGAWLIFADPLGAVWGAPRPGLSRTDAFRQSFELLPWRGRQMVGVFGWVDAPATLPAWAASVWLAVVAALVGCALWVGSWRSRIGVVSSVLAVVGLTTSEALEAERVGFIWQGRYSLPLAVTIPILAAFVIGRSDRIPARWREPLAGSAFVVLALVQWLAVAVTLRRFVIGESSPILDVITTDGWDPPLAPVVVLGGAALMLVAQTAWYIALTRARTPDQAPAVNSAMSTVSSTV